jgi:UDP-2,3-diacylglucosamine pyrophosphatase LpxH
MYPLELIAVGIIIAAFLASVLNFRFLLYPLIPSLNPLTSTRQLTLTGNTLFIADLHLRAGHPFKFAKDLRNFVEQRHVSNLVVVGDLFDSPKDAQEILSNSSISTILGLEDSLVKVYRLAGSPHHDPIQEEAAEAYRGSAIWLGRCASISFGRLKVLAYHGHDLSSIGAVGHAWDRFISKLSLERLWKQLAGVSNTDWAVFGHTHIGALDVRHRLANCGGWVAVPYLVHPSGTGIFFLQESGSLQLVQISHPVSGVVHSNWPWCGLF